MRDQQALQHAKRLRVEQTPAEVRLWHHLRAGRFAGWKFRRQTVIGPFFADFTCRPAGLVIEVDGDTHAGREDEDGRRTRYLERQGWRVVRFTNAEVSGNLEGVLQRLAELLSPSPDPLP